MHPDRHTPSAIVTFPHIVVPHRLALRLLAAVAAGCGAACGFPPLGLWVLTIIGVAWLIELTLQAQSKRQAFALGWCFGLGHFTLGNNWIATAFTYQAEMPAWLGAISVVLLALYLALFPAFTCLFSWLSLRTENAKIEGKGRAYLPFVLAFAGFWVLTEWLRSWLFTGFAWNPLAVALLGDFAHTGWARLAPWLGTYGLSGVVVICASLLGAVARLALPSDNKRSWTGTALVSIALLGMVWGMYQPPSSRAEGGIAYTLVQPDLRQEVIDDTSQFESNARKLITLSLPKNPGDKRVVLWPESGLSDFLRDGYPQYFYTIYTFGADPYIARKRLGQAIGPYGLLLTGAVDLVVEKEASTGARNAVTAIDGHGDILAGYSKAHLVPFGEYLPLRGLLEPLGLSRLVAGMLDFIPGPGPQTLDFGAYGKAGIQICYEIVFSGQVVDRHNRPDYIFNPSNDGWFGAWGPPQHLAQARLRAIEEGLPVLRSTTTGISAVIDADGIVRAHVPHQQAGRLDGLIPLAHAPTFFARFGNAIPLTFAALLIIASFCVVALTRRRV